MSAVNKFALKMVLACLIAAAASLSHACRRDSDCDDGLWCNGVEHCEGVVIDSENHRVIEGQCRSGARPCGYDDRETICLEKEHRCQSAWGEECNVNDRDGDGSIAVACGGDDCDDNNPNRYPGNTEVCNLVDEDCDPATLGGDRDGDGYVSSHCEN